MQNRTQIQTRFVVVVVAVVVDLGGVCSVKKTGNTVSGENKDI